MNFLKQLILLTASMLILLAASGISIASDGGFGGGSGSLEDPFLIEDAADFKAIQKNLSAHYKLVNNIDLSGSDLKPIGNQTNPFKGSLTGGSGENGLYEISNFKCIVDTGPIGLFGWTDNARFSNLVLRNFLIETTDRNRGGFLASTINNSTEVVDCTVIDSKLSGFSHLGLIGYSNHSMISDCLSENIQIKGAGNIGGILGYGLNTEIINGRSDGTLVGKQSVGGIVGSLEAGSIDGSSSSCTIKVISEPKISPVEPQNFGGLAGLIISVSVADSSAKGDIEGDIEATSFYTGGLIGYSSSSVFRDCYVTGDVIGTKDSSRVGGLLGGSSSSTVFNCSAEGAVKGTQYVGGLLGSSSGDTISESFAEGIVEGMMYVGGLIGFSSDDTISQSSATGTVGGTESSYVGGLIGYSYLDAISESSVLEDARAEGMMCVGGLAGMAYSSEIEDCSIASAAVVKGSDNIGGLIGYLTGGSVTKCIAEGSVEGINSVGGLAGNVSGSVISESAVTADIKSTGSYLGGIAGSLEKGDILKCSVTGDIIVPEDASYGQAVGGIVGNLYQSSISECFVSGTTEIIGKYDVGGIAGHLYQSDISGCFVTGDTKVTGSSGVGGLVGVSDTGEITDSYVAGNSIVIGDSVIGDYIGGLAGQLVDSSLSRSFMAGDISGNDYIGGLAGSMNINANYAVSDCYVTGDVLGTGSVGGLVGDLYAGEIKNSLALNEFVTGSTDVGRIYGLKTDGTLSNTCAWINMSDGSDHFKDGETNVTSVEVWRKYPSSGWETSGFGGDWELNTYGDFLLPVHAWTDKNVAANATHLIPKYFIIYNGNGHTSGTVPVDGTAYLDRFAPAAAIISDAGNMGKSNSGFNGWNTAADGSGMAYAAGASLLMDSDMTLYAQWKVPSTPGGGPGTGSATVTDPYGSAQVVDPIQPGYETPVEPEPIPEIIIILFFMIAVACYLFVTRVEIEKENG